MDKEWVEKQIRTVDPESAWDALHVAEAIAAQHEAEIEKKDTVLRELDTALERLCTQHEAEVAELKAQMAVMTGALRLVLELTDHDTGEAYKSDWLVIELAIEKALSAAPKVVWHGVMDRVDWLDLADLPELSADMEQQFDILVLAHEPGCSVEVGRSVRGEQPQSSEQEE